MINLNDSCRLPLIYLLDHMDIRFYLIINTVSSFCIHLYINTGELSLWHVPSTFATVNTHANVFFVFLPGVISKERRHIVSANCDFEENYFADIVSCLRAFRGTPGETKNSSRES